MVKELDNTMTQAAFGELVGIGQPAVSDLLRREIIRPGATGGAWLEAYCEHLRTIAAGRDPSGELSTERARVARATAERIEMANAVTRSEYAPVGVLESVLSDIARQLASRLDALVPLIRRRLPDLQASVLTQIDNEINACRALCASANLADADKLVDGDTDDEAVDNDGQAQPAAPSNPNQQTVD